MTPRPRPTPGVLTSCGTRRAPSLLSGAALAGAGAALLCSPLAVSAQPSAPPPALGAAPTAEERVLPYSLEIVPTGDEGLDEAIAGASQLGRLRELAPTDAFGLVGRALGDLGRLDAALRSEGYYAGRARIEIAGLPLPGTPDLAERLARVEAPVPVRILVEPGPRYRITSVAVRPATPAAAAAVAAVVAEPFGLAPGDPATAAAVLDAGETLLDRLRRAGHPFPADVERTVIVDHRDRGMEVEFVLAPGPRSRFAPPRVVGQVRTDTVFLERLAGRIAGQPYSPERIERVRRDLRTLGVFAAVRARPAERLDAAGTLPVTFEVEERPPRAVGFSLAYETDFGPTGRIYWEHRNLLGGAERLRLEADVYRLETGRGGADDFGFRIGGSLRSPFLYGRDLTLTADGFALRDRLRAYDRDVVIASLLLERQLTDRLAVLGGPLAEFGRVGREDDMRPVQLLGATLGVRWDGTDSLLDPRRGWRVAFTATPAYELREAIVFARLRLTASAYWDVTGDGGSVIALRGALGSVAGAERDRLPLDQRFYAGGGGSVRGYTYQAIGPRDATGRPVGGASLVEGSIELRQRLWGELGGVLFLDAGTVGRDPLLPDLGGLRFGAGVGLRYRTVIGPIRADVAVPLNRGAGESRGYGFYLGIGQAF